MTCRHRSCFLLLIGVFLLLVAPTARAADIEVPGGSVDAIQAAVDQAGPGGTVILGAGDHVLTQTVTIPYAGLRVVSRGGGDLLGRTTVAGAFLPLFSITAIDVQILGLNVGPAIGNAGDLSLAVASGAHGLVVTGCRAAGVVQLVNAGDARDLTVTQNRVDSVDPLGVGGPMANLAVIRSTGAGSVKIAQNRLEGFRPLGSAGVASYPAADSEHIVEKNTIIGYDRGIRADGTGVVRARRNKIVRCTNGIDMAETTVAIGWVIFKNKVVDTLAAGIYLEDGDNCEISKNTVKGAGTDGINVGGVFITIQKNKSRLNAGAGIFGATNSCNYVTNKTVRNGRGLRVEGTGNRLRKNRAQRNLGDGVVSTGGNVNMGKNRGKRNGGINVSIS